MKTFKDNEGREWLVSVDVAAIKRCRELLEEDLLDVQQVLERLMIDPILLCDVVFVVCKPQADERGISDEQFARAMGGEAIARAKRALVEDLVDFFPDQADRENLRAAVEKYNQMATRARQMIRVRLDSPRLSQEIEAALSSVGDSFGNSPESSASTPGR
jgi:hypothetical protein